MQAALLAAGLFPVACRAVPPGAGTLSIAPHAEPTSRLSVRLGDPLAAGRRVAALPASWDQAVVRFDSPTALVTPREWLIPRAAFSWVNPYFQFDGTGGSTPQAPPLKPASNYAVSCFLEAGAGNSLTAYAGLTGQTLTGGANTVLSFNLATTGNVGAAMGISGSAGTDYLPQVAQYTTSDYVQVFGINTGNVYLSLTNVGTGAAGGATQVNQLAGNADSPVVAFNPAVGSAGGYVTAWNDYRTSGTTGIEIFARAVVNGIGWSAERQLTANANDQRAPAVAARRNGSSPHSLIVWEDFRNGNADIYGVVVNGGALNDATYGAGPVFAIATGAGNQRDPAIAYSSVSDQYFVVFEDDANAGVSGVDLRYQRVNAATNALLDGTGGAVLTSAAGNQTDPAVAVSDDGQFFTAWVDARSGNNDIYHAVYKTGAGFTVPDTPTIVHSADQIQPAAVWDMGTRGWLVTFIDNRFAGATGYDLFYRRLRPDALTLWNERAIITANGAEQRPAVSCATTGQLYAVVETNPTGSNVNLIGMRFR